MWRKVYHAFRCWANGLGRESAPYRRTEITVETNRTWIVRKPPPTRCRCPECGREVDMVVPEEAEAPSQEEKTENRAISETRCKSDEN
jgi:hypothetical protein